MEKTERILVGFDFSPCSTLALQYGIDMASRMGAKLDVLFVEVLHGEAYNAATKEKLERLLEEQLILRGRPDLEVGQTIERYFAAAPAIVEHADRTSAGLIVLGTHGRRGLRAFMLGSVAHEVVRRSPVPVLTVRCKRLRDFEPHSIETILVPFDFSRHSRRALEKAVEVANMFDSRIRVLHVIEDRFHPAFYGPFFQSIYDLDPDIEKKSLAHLQEEVDAWSDSGITIEIDAVRGHPSSQIVDYADKHDVDLVVMSTHGLTGLERLAMGSVAERTVSSATCPVLTLRVKAEFNELAIQGQEARSEPEEV